MLQVMMMVGLIIALWCSGCCKKWQPEKRPTKTLAERIKHDDVRQHKN